MKHNLLEDFTFHVQQLQIWTHPPFSHQRPHTFPAAANSSHDLELSGYSIQQGPHTFPAAANSSHDLELSGCSIPQGPHTFPAAANSSHDLELSGCSVQQFVPYSGRIPWHTGLRGFMSKLFPKYGNYCGPNWSSGRDRGSLVWDSPPVDGLDYCCYLHDVGYDSHSQMDLHKADLAFLNCLQPLQLRKNSSIKGIHKEETFIAAAYRSAYILGLKRFLIPYRKSLLRQQLAKAAQQKGPGISDQF